MPYDLRPYLKRLTTIVLAWTGLTLANVGCSNDLPTQLLKADSATLLARLQLNYKGIVLSVHAPYDTVRLDAVALNLRGEALTHTGTLTFRRQNLLDNSVSVDSTGLVRARSAIGTTRVIVSLTLDGVQRTDTAVIAVRTESPVRKIARLEFSPPATDSARRWAGTTTEPILTNWVRLYDAQNVLIPNENNTLIFSSDNPEVFLVGSRVEYLQQTAFRTVGEAWLRVRFYAYDTGFRDSVLFRRIEPPIKFVMVSRVVPVNGPVTIVFNPSQLEIKPGMTVVFVNRLGTSDPGAAGGLGTNLNRILRTTSFGDYVHEWVDSTGITFEAPPGPVLAGDSYGRISVGIFNATAGYPSDGGTGNIPSFSWVRCLQVNTASTTACAGGSGTPKIRTLDTGFRSRKFTTPGTYRFVSTAFPDASGTIVVTAP